MSVVEQLADTLITAMMVIIIFLVTISSSIFMIRHMIEGRIKVSGVTIGSLIALFLFLTTAICYLLHIIFQDWLNQLSLSKNIRIIGGVWYLLGGLSMIYSFITRICFTFKETALAISNSTKICLYAVFWVLIVGIFVIVIINALKLDILLGIIGSLWILMYIILSIMLLSSFIHKLKTLAIGNSSIHSIDMELLYVVIKNGILVPIAIISSLLSMIFALVIRVIGPQYDVPQIIVFDATVSSCCLFLLLSNGKYIYNRVCHCCHHQCQQWQINKVQTKMLKPKLVHHQSHASHIVGPSIQIQAKPSTNKETNNNVQTDLVLMDRKSEPLRKENRVPVLFDYQSYPN